MELPTIKLRNKHTGAIRIVNQTKYADNLGQWGAWEIISMRGGSASDATVAMERSQERIEVQRQLNPKSPAYGDAERAFKARGGAEINTEYTSAVKAPEYSATERDFTTTTDAPAQPVVEERTVPVIGGSEVVKVRGKPGRKPKVSPSQDEIL